MSKYNVRDLTYAGLFTAIIVVLSYVSIPLPFSPVPVTGQSLAIMLAGSILTRRQATLSVLTFLFLGIIGVPVFAGGTSGIRVLLGPTGGFLIGFLASVITISLLKGNGNRLISLAIANTLGGIVILYSFGVVWLSISTGIQLSQAFLSGALPFIPGDIIKVIIATPLSLMINQKVKALITA